jgi:hypothetical protein
MLACLLVGCQSNPDKKVEIDRSPPRGTTQPAYSPETMSATPTSYEDGIGLSNAPAVLKINFEVIRLHTRAGIFSQSEKIWNYLSESELDPRRNHLLRLNGLRIAKGKSETWPAIKTLLDEADIQCTTSSQSVSNALPLEIKLDPVPRDQTLFLFRPNRTLAGFPYPNSVNQWRIEFAIPLEDIDSVEVTPMPETQLPYHQPRSKLTVNGWEHYPIERPSRIFRELACTLRIGPDEFFVIGPSEQSGKKHLIGSAFLCNEIDGLEYESMYVITPRVVSSKPASLTP